MDADEELRAAVRRRPGWKIRDGIAEYRRRGADWQGRVRHLAYPTRPREPWLAVFTDADGARADLTVPAASAAEAVGRVERRA